MSTFSGYAEGALDISNWKYDNTGEGVVNQVEQGVGRQRSDGNWMDGQRFVNRYVRCSGFLRERRANAGRGVAPSTMTNSADRCEKVARPPPARFVAPNRVWSGDRAGALHSALTTPRMHSTIPGTRGAHDSSRSLEPRIPAILRL